MKLIFNGKTIETDAITLTDVLKEQGFDANSHVATAVNGKFVPKTARDKQSISDGDAIEVVAPMQGG